MNNQRVAFLASLFVLCLATPVLGGEVPPSPEDIATAREQFRLGAHYAKNEQWAKALEAYERSMALRPSPLTRYSIAIAQQHLGQWVESMENLRIFLQEKHDEVTAGYVAPAKNALQVAEKKIARIHVTVPGNPRGLRVQIDDKKLSAAVVGVDWLTNPGKHVVRVTIPNYEPFEKTVQLEPGGRVEVRATFRNAEGAVYTGEEDLEETDAGGRSSGGTKGWVTVAVGGAIFAGGVTFGVLGYLQGKDATTPGDEHADKARSYALVGDVSMAAGLLVTGVGGYLLLRENCNKASGEEVAKVRHTGWRLAPWVSADSGGVSVAGKF